MSSAKPQVCAAFDAAFERLIGHEGGYTANPADPGNWTGGACGQGACKGTRYGVSAAAYPALDIKALTLAEARAIFRRDYWDKIGGDKLPPAVAFVCFDAAVNNGVSRAVRLLQAALNLDQDGIVGPATLAAAARVAPMELVSEMVAQRMMFMAKLNTWPTFGLGWARRLAALPMEAFEVASVISVSPQGSENAERSARGSDTARMDFLERRAVANAHLLRLLGIGPSEIGSADLRGGATLRMAIDQAITEDVPGAIGQAGPVGHGPVGHSA